MRESDDQYPNRLLTRPGTASRKAWRISIRGASSLGNPGGSSSSTSGVLSASKSVAVMNSGNGFRIDAPGSGLFGTDFQSDSRRRSAVGTTLSISDRGSSQRTPSA